MDVFTVVFSVVFLVVTFALGFSLGFGRGKEKTIVKAREITYTRLIHESHRSYIHGFDDGRITGECRGHAASSHNSTHCKFCEDVRKDPKTFFGSIDI